ncbi:serine/threonine-protein kinase [Nonomuraea wenchangensis]|uniref:Serine/threonine protein kinase n=1 Tax=Nonomuraea wenchangensis TaxID=568860 RepID=A0A1I0LR27_9ACTN|nr:serine/threonine-protein kinase [Nonomuraea wenchangensis]SEU44636.1 Serine/threonine protein kinase [Nonomuraea wenchangensis]
MGRSAGTPLKPEDPPAIGSYELVSRLGSGGMGVVYLAKAADGSRVALKAIRRDYTADPVYRARFHEEVSNARKVASFCTARVLDHGEDRGVLYLVTEFIDGISLEDHLIEHGALSPSVLHAAAVGVAAALTAIHAAGLVHRDLKPANVMLTLAGPRVIDFGLARSTHVNARHTNAGMVMGTPGWIAPEQVFEGRTSPAGDVFAWGSLIAYAGLGGHPFGEGDAYVMAARARTAPPDLRGLPAPLDRLVAAAIHPDPSRRPTARQLLLELVEAADEPAAQLAATKHLTNAWNASEFAPLTQPPGPQGPGGQGPGVVPPAERTGPTPGMQPPPAERTGPTPGSSRGPHVPPQGAPIPQNAQIPPQGSPMQQRPPAGSPHPGAAMPPGAPAHPGASAHPGAAVPPVPPAERSGPVPGGMVPPHQTGQMPLPRHPRGNPGPPPHHATTGQGPLPGYPPPRRKRSLATGCLTALVVAAVLVVLVLAALAWLFRGPDAGADGQVQDGKLRFSVTGTTCQKPAKAATKRTCRVGVQVANVGPDARVLYPGQQKLVAEDDDLHGGVKLLDAAGKEITPIRIESGGAFTGTLVFDLPKKSKPVGLEVHDSGLSSGARITLV